MGRTDDNSTQNDVLDDRLPCEFVLSAKPPRVPTQNACSLHGLSSSRVSIWVLTSHITGLSFTDFIAFSLPRKTSSIRLLGRSSMGRCLIMAGQNASTGRGEDRQCWNRSSNIHELVTNFSSLVISQRTLSIIFRSDSSSRVSWTSLQMLSAFARMTRSARIIVFGPAPIGLLHWD